jgi:hypothetical protein
LQRDYSLDIDGDGSAELYVTQAQANSANQVLCQNEVLHWKDGTTGFVDIGLNLPQYDCVDPSGSKLTDLFLDVDGDGRLDHVLASSTNFFNNSVTSIDPAFSTGECYGSRHLGDRADQSKRRVWGSDEFSLGAESQRRIVGLPGLLCGLHWRRSCSTIWSER